MIETNRIICGHCGDIMRKFPAECIDLVVTSPPYDNLRDYQGCVFWFEEIAQQLKKIKDSVELNILKILLEKRITNYKQEIQYMSILKHIEILV